MSKFYVGQKVRIKGDFSDATDHLDGKIGVIIDVMPRDCFVHVEDCEYCKDWFVWNYNMTPVDVTDSEA